MASLKSDDIDCEDTQTYPNIIKQLKLQEYYPKKLTREKALAVSNIDISTDDLKDPGKIPWFILQNMIMCNYEGMRFEVNEHKPLLSGTGDSLPLLESHSDRENDCDHTEHVSPLDSLVALFWCCDDFLRQILVERLLLCQLAIPLLLPIDSPYGSEMLMWALSTLRKQWKTRSGSSCEQSMVFHKSSIVSAIRFGRPRISKSKILNKVISDLKHDIFFHSDCNGGANRKIADGLLEMAYYLPNGKRKDMLSEAVTFMNLRGNASYLKGQIRFISEISFATIVFMSSESLKEEDKALLKPLYEQDGHLIIVLDEHSKGKLKDSFCALEKSCLKVSDKQVKYIYSSTKKELLISKKIKECLKSIYKGSRRYVVPDRSIKMCVDVAKTMCFEVDDDNTQDYLITRKTTEMMIDSLKQHGKEKQLPLQMIAKENGERQKTQYYLERDEHNAATKDSENVLDTSISFLRMKQKIVCEEDLGILKLFSRSYTFTAPARKYCQSYLKILTYNNNIDEMQSVRQEYINKLDKLHRHLQKHQKSRTKLEKIKARKAEIECLESELSNLSLGLEHFNRELGQMYEMKSDLNLLDYSTRQLPVAAAELFLDGYPLELMNGDAIYVPLTWIEAILRQKIIDDNRIFVLSVLGVQNSGKSTMLNTMFGLQLPVNAGRCTKGIFAQLVPVDTNLQKSTGCDYIMVVDTEGLRAPELAGLEHSDYFNKLATLAIGLSDATIFNIRRELVIEIKETLENTVLAFMKIESVKIKPRVIFVHQNIKNVGRANMNTDQKISVKNMLDEITKRAADKENCGDKYETFSDVIEFNENKDVMYVSRFQKADSSMAPVDPGYSRSIYQVKKQLIQCLQNSQAKSVKDFMRKLSDLSKAIP
ncbi:interferon-induced very large GTPase 1-like [Anneissia japonica]|uniref:interferon-induced very large GTPase 1-like n=1 Tax=Anneissia japonica TaxID=1529436 RepID=UPI001425BB7B|nr:interferon-induced very large GTPase 1-like [Anneissia japonica]